MTVVAVLGTGRMGSALARALARSGVDLVLFNRTEARAQELARELGARVATSAADAVRQGDVSLSMVVDEHAINELYRDPGGALEGAHPGGVVADLSTVPPSTIRSLEADVRATGSGIIDAPVSGSTSVAEAGQLTLMVGGEAADLERARPALEPISKTIFHVGPLGSGAAMKLAVNSAVFALNQAIAEALVLAERAGISRETAYDVLAASVVGSPYVQYKRAAFLDPDATPVAFANELAQKDMRLIAAFAAELGVEIPQAVANAGTMHAAGETEGLQNDASLVARHLRRKSGGAPD